MHLVLAVLVFAHLSLHDAQADALVHSPDVALARAKAAEARALFNQAKATYGPALTASYAASPQANAATTGTAIQQMTTVGAQWTLGDLFAYAPAVAEANAALRAAQLALSDAERSQQLAVTTAYYAALQARATLRARNDALASARAELRAARLRFQAGDAPQLDVVRATVAVAGAQADVARARAGAADADESLAQATGVTPAALREMRVVPGSEAEASLPSQTTAAGADSATVQLALATRPDIAAARANVRAEEHAVGVARRGGWPLVTISGGYTRGIDTGVAVSGPSASVDVTIPVTGAAHDRVLAEEARLDEARAQLDKIERSVMLEVSSAIRSYQAQTTALAASARALDSARLEFAATQIGYRSGAVSSLDLENARSTYVQALVAQISSLYALANARAALDLILGGRHA